ncbi:MAG: SpvB/TcaC N-terminal domain-containing protein, partial [Candidatus Omnitrophota bacterium]
ETPQNFTTTFSDPDGWQNIQYVYFLINASTDGKNCFYGYYNRNSNKLYLRNDTSSAWLGGYIPGAGNIIENSYAKLDCAQTTVTNNSNTLTVKWNIIFKPAFTGAKKLYLYIRDNANAYQNWVQKGTWTALANGKVITPDGGEVTSSDGKVKLIIPANALNEPTVINISSVNKETLQNTAPSGTSLLSVVDCQPYSLVFNKPIQIVYKLDTPEIPGTPVELGLYDSAQNKIVPTGQVSTIPADGYNVSFSLQHFSTYAALKNLTPQQAPIGAGVKVPLPDMLTGAFGHTIAINIPPGRKGIQPNLGLTYRSGNSNSWVGLGFSLNPGYIVRSTRLGPPTYIDTQDTFYFITDAGTTELVCLIDNLYQAKVESSFTKFFKEADGSWRAIGKDGSVLKFGQNESAREIFPQGTFSWYITKATDTNGNYLEYQYIKDQGKVYPSRIDYTGNESAGFSPKNSVEFFLEPRNDIASSYISGAKIATAKRLKEIQAKVDGELAWRYVLEYAYSEDTNRSLLKSINQYASDDKSLPMQKFSYQKA